MGFLDFFRSAEQVRANSVRDGKVAPVKTERQRCYDARDAFYACLDANGILDAEKDATLVQKTCRDVHTRFQQDCPAVWVSFLFVLLFFF